MCSTCHKATPHLQKLMLCSRSPRGGLAGGESKWRKNFVQEATAPTSPATRAQVQVPPGSLVLHDSFLLYSFIYSFYYYYYYYYLKGRMIERSDLPYAGPLLSDACNSQGWSRLKSVIRNQELGAQLRSPTWVAGTQVPDPSSAATRKLARKRWT